MKKSLIAMAALATVASAAQAQSSVTVYGSFDTGYNSMSVKNASGSLGVNGDVKGMNSVSTAGALTSSRLGFRGEEDLGGGLRARFNLEYGFFGNTTGDTATAMTYASGTASTANTATNIENQASGASIQTRTSRIGLSSARLGSLDVGYGLTGLFGTVTGHSPLPGNNFIGDVAYTSTTLLGGDSRILAGAVRMNGVNYTTPTMNGFSARADWGAGNIKTDPGTVADVRASNAGLTLNYSAGAFAAAATMHKLKTDTVGTTNNITTTDFTAISARYSITPNLAVNALYAANKSETATATAFGQSGKNDVQQVGLRYDMGKNTFAVQYGTGDGEGSTSNINKRDRKGYQLAAIHNMSKRTNVYALYGNHQVNYQTDANGASTGVKEKATGVAVGLRHSF